MGLDITNGQGFTIFCHILNLSEAGRKGTQNYDKIFLDFFIRYTSRQTDYKYGVKWTALGFEFYKETNNGKRFYNIFYKLRGSWHKRETKL